MRSAIITAAFVSLAIGPVLAQYAPSTPSTTADTPPSARTLPATPPPAGATANPAARNSDNSTATTNSDNSAPAITNNSTIRNSDNVAPNSSANANTNAPTNPAVKTAKGNNPGAPVPGANSFTEGQAKSRIEADGFSNVSGLIKYPNGIWRGMAMKDGKQVQVALDFQGNVVTE